MLARTVLAVPVLTLGLGAAGWFVIGGPTAFGGPMPALREAWLPIYRVQSVLAAAVTFVFVRLLERVDRRRLMLLVLAAWLGELTVLLVGGRVIANELVPEVAGLFWLIATGGPIQPIAAVDRRAAPARGVAAAARAIARQPPTVTAR